MISSSSVLLLSLALASTVSARDLHAMPASVQSEIASVAGVNPATITSPGQLSSVPPEYWQHVIDDLPKELPFAKLWTGGWCPLAYGNPAPLGPGTSRTACIKCTDGCAVCPKVFYDCTVCIPGYGLSDGACQKLVY